MRWRSAGGTPSPSSAKESCQPQAAALRADVDLRALAPAVADGVGDQVGEQRSQLVRVAGDDGERRARDDGGARLELLREVVEDRVERAVAVDVAGQRLGPCARRP